MEIKNLNLIQGVRGGSGALTYLILYKIKIDDHFAQKIDTAFLRERTSLFLFFAYFIFHAKAKSTWVCVGGKSSWGVIFTGSKMH